MRIVSSRLDSFVESMSGNLDRTGRVWARVGVIVLVVAMAMSFDFGWQVSWKHAAFLAGLTFVAAFGPEVAYKAIEERKVGSGIAIAVFSAILLSIQFGVDQSYTAGIRGLNRDVTRVQNVKYDGAQDGVQEARTSLKLWETRLGELQTANAWAGTVTAEALRAQMASAQLALDLEAKRGGCKSKCLERTKERDALAAKIAIAEERSTLEREIAATKKVIGSARDKADTTEHKSSAVVHANTAIAKTIAFFGAGMLAPSAAIEEGTDISTNMAMALAATGVPAFAFFIAGLYRIPGSRRQGEPARDLAPSGIPLVHPAVGGAGFSVPPRSPGYALRTETIGDLRRLAAA